MQVDKKEIRMSSVELYQPLLFIACVRRPPDADIFEYEVALVAPYLFQHERIMRKFQKSLHRKYIIQLDCDIFIQEMK